MNFPTTGILYALTPSNPPDWSETLKKCRTMLENGVTVFQFRDKDISDEVFTERATELGKLVHEYGGIFIINDRVHLAQTCGADGVHIGQDDMSIEEARKLIGEQAIIGVSIHNSEEARHAELHGANYVGANGFAPSQTKPELHPLGQEGIQSIRRETTLPIIAIGGITKENAAEAMAAGADGVAVISALFNSENIENTCQELQAEIHRGLEMREATTEPSLRREGKL